MPLNHTDAMSQTFTHEVSAHLKTYVYRLIDPRNGETFYVGKGVRNRVFEHARAVIDSDDPTDKLNRIREINAAGFATAHVIHRHGMDDDTACEVEAALIDAYPGLTNIVTGVGSNDFGAMHADEIIRKYEAVEAVFDHNAIMINVSRTAAEHSLLDATRYAWKISVERARKAEVILAVQHGLIIGVFIAESWHPATADHFPGFEPVPGRYGFIGRHADNELAEHYNQKRVPARFRKPGAANPIRYTY
jgi:hypothetical protein